MAVTRPGAFRGGSDAGPGPAARGSAGSAWLPASARTPGSLARRSRSRAWADVGEARPSRHRLRGCWRRWARRALRRGTAAAAPRPSSDPQRRPARAGLASRTARYRARTLSFAACRPRPPRREGGISRCRCRRGPRSRRMPWRRPGAVPARRPRVETELRGSGRRARAAPAGRARTAQATGRVERCPVAGRGPAA